MRIATPDPGENGQAAEPRHDEVEEDPLNGRRFEYPQAFGAIEGDERLVTEAADRLRDHLGHRRIVIHHQDSHGSRRVPVSGPAASSSRASGECPTHDARARSWSSTARPESRAALVRAVVEADYSVPGGRDRCRGAGPPRRACIPSSSSWTSITSTMAWSWPGRSSWRTPTCRCSSSRARRTPTSWSRACGAGPTTSW